MKRFLAILLISVVAVSLGFAVYFVATNTEKIALPLSTMYKEVGEQFEIELDHENVDNTTEIEITSSDDSVVSYENGVYTAHKGGVARITFTTSNINFRNLHCDVLVGDGSKDAPYYISTAAQLASIGLPITNEEGIKAVKYRLSDNYKLVGDIDLKPIYNGYWRPLGEFTGWFDGNGKTIYNLNLNPQDYVANNYSSGGYEEADFSNAGLFSIISQTSLIYNLKINGFNAKGTFDSLGTIAGINYGIIERIEVKNAFFDTEATYAGGISGQNISSTIDTPFVEKVTAIIDRTSVELLAGLTIVAGADEVEYLPKGITGTFGGITGYNQGGNVLFSYTKGSVHLGEKDIVYGGLVGFNTYKNHEGVATDNISGGNLKDSYSAIYLYVDKVENIEEESIGALVGINSVYKSSDEKLSNTVIGLYYDNNRFRVFEEGINKEELLGVGMTEITDSNSVITQSVVKEERYYVQGYSSSILKTQPSLYSHIRKDTLVDSNGNIIKVDNVIVMWKFGEIWNIDIEENEGYPQLNYLPIKVEDQFEKSRTVVLNNYLLEISQAVSGVQLNATNYVDLKIFDGEGKAVSSSNSHSNLKLYEGYTLVKKDNNILVYDLFDSFIYLISYNMINKDYDFVEWTLNGNSNWSSVVVKRDYALIAWVRELPNASVVTLEYNGATGGNFRTSINVIYGAKYSSLPTPSRTNYVFKGWYKESTFKTLITKDTTVTTRESHKLFAQWESNEVEVPVVTNYTVSLNANGGSVSPTTKAVSFNASYSLPVPTRTGYTFKGWYDATSGGTQYTNANGNCLKVWTVSSNKTLYAQWTANTYYVAFYSNGGTGSSMSSQAFFYGSSQALRANTYTRANHNFIGWSTSSSGGVSYSNQQVVNNLTTTNGVTINLYAVWKQVTAPVVYYSVVLQANGGSIDGASSKTYSLTYNQSYSFPTPTRTGYTFTGWKDSSGSYSSSGKWTYYKSATLTAQWKVKTYTVTRNTNGGNSMGSTTVTHGSYYNLGVPTRAGYTFTGWYLYSNLSGKLTDTSGASLSKWSYTANQTVYAAWSARSYTVTRNANGGTSMGSVTVKYGSYYNLGVPTRAGYTFTGWRLGSTSGTLITSSTGVSKSSWGYTSNQTVYASWSAKTFSFKVRFYRDNAYASGPNYVDKTYTGTVATNFRLFTGNELGFKHSYGLVWNWRYYNGITYKYFEPNQTFKSTDFGVWGLTSAGSEILVTVYAIWAYQI